MYHVIRVEFQVRGSSHVHVFIWAVDPPVTNDTIDEYIAFVNGIIRADLYIYIITKQNQNYLTW